LIKNEVIFLVNETESVVGFYDKTAKKFSETVFDYLHKEQFDEFLEFMPKNAKILDIGCGPAHPTKYLKENGFSVEGIDLSKELIKIAKQKVPEVTFKLMDLRKLDYSAENFDGLFACYSLIHIPEKEVLQTLIEFNRVLKLNGFLFLAIQEGKGEGFVESSMHEKEKVFIKYFSEEEIKNFLEEAGFEVVKISKTPAKHEWEHKSDKLFVIARKVQGF